MSDRVDLYSVFIALNIVDWVITCMVILHGGYEVNPVMAFIIDRFGLFALGYYKMVVSTIVCIALYKFSTSDAIISALDVVMLILCIAMGWQYYIATC